MCFAAGSSIVAQPAFAPSDFHTSARFSIDADALSLSTGVATIEPRAQGYRWLRVYFYSFPLTPADVAGAMKGNVDSMERKWTSKAGNPKDYNHSHAVLQLTVDRDRKVTQVDLSVPGHTCTIAGSTGEAAKALPGYQFDGKRLTLKGKGSFICDMSFAKSPNRTYGWDLDLDIPVFEKVP
jgi:hypothetical protein